MSIADFRFLFRGALRAHLLNSAIANRKSKIKDGRLREGYSATFFALLYDGERRLQIRGLQITNVAL